MFLEYDWTSGVYKFRFGHVFTSVDGFWSAATLAEARYILDLRRLKLGKKTDTRTWEIVSVYQ